MKTPQTGFLLEASGGHGQDLCFINISYATHWAFLFFFFLCQNSLHFSLLECLLLLWGFEKFLRVSGHLPTPRGTKEPTTPLY